MYKILKRLLDLFVALALVVVLSPFLLIIIVLLLLTGEHEVFYTQSRIGFKNEKFDIWKFATMLKNSPSLGSGSITLRNDPRVTSIGHYLRITKINELPQFINLLIGNMTLVGPRPHMDVDFRLYPPHIQKIIFNVKPGITGIGSLIFRDQEMIFTKAKVDPHLYYQKFMAPFKGDLEIWYQNNMSFYLDLKILILTAWIIVKPSSDIIYNFFPELPPTPKFPTFEEMSPSDRVACIKPVK
jgi:lipopolysaccharide/colanic/teichoic acid biosynthesis glycosyltransferase